MINTRQKALLQPVLLKCHIKGCKSPMGTPLYKFPLPGEATYNRWSKALQLNYDPDKDYRVCSKHFKESDFASMPGQKAMKLKASAIPSMNLAPLKRTIQMTRMIKAVTVDPLIEKESVVDSEQNDLAENSFNMGIRQVLEILEKYSDGTGLDEIMHFESEGKIVLMYNKKPVEEYLEELDDFIVMEDENTLDEDLNCLSEEDTIIEEEGEAEIIPQQNNIPKEVFHDYSKSTPNMLTVYECPNCGFSCDTMDKMKYHTKLCIEKMLPFQCGMCDVKFKQAKMLAEHIKDHRANKTYVVSDVLNPDSRRRQPKNEPVIINTSDIRPIIRKPKRVDVRKKTCKRCQIEMLECQMPIHAQIHKNSDNIRRMCEFCELAYQSQAELEEHYEEHHVMEKYVCVFCQLALTNKKELFNHHKTHDVEDYIKYTRQKESVRTVQIAGAFYYECNLCCGIFLSRTAIQNHLQMHRLTIKSHQKFYCYSCCIIADEEHIRNKKCSNRNMADHQMRLNCDVCGIICPTKAVLDEHVDSEHHEDYATEEWLI